jgi:hypothetical protein
MKLMKLLCLQIVVNIKNKNKNNIYKYKMTKYLEQDENNKSPWIINEDFLSMNNTVNRFKLFINVLQELSTPEDNKTLSTSQLDVVNYFRWLHPFFSLTDDICRENFKMDDIKSDVDEYDFYCKNLIRAKMKKYPDKYNPTRKESQYINDQVLDEHPIWIRLRYLSFYKLLEMFQGEYNENMIKLIVESHPHNSFFFKYVRNNAISHTDIEKEYKKIISDEKKNEEKRNQKEEQDKFFEKVGKLVKDVDKNNYTMRVEPLKVKNICSHCKKELQLHEIVEVPHESGLQKDKLFICHQCYYGLMKEREVNKYIQSTKKVKELECFKCGVKNEDMKECKQCLSDFCNKCCDLKEDKCNGCRKD